MTSSLAAVLRVLRDLLADLCGRQALSHIVLRACR
jgi:hypothetical protein